MRLLLVDDSIEMLRAMTLYFESGGHEVVGHALDGRDAVDLAGELLPDAALVDFDMPGMSGVDTVRQLKAVMPALLVVVVSGHDHPEYAVQSVRAGADAFVSKRKLHEELLPLLRSSADRNP